MGQDDANDAGPGECPGHEFELQDLVNVTSEGTAVPGLALVHACKWCGAIDYEPSAQDDPNRGRLS